MIEKYKKLKPSRLVVIGCFVSTILPSAGLSQAFQGQNSSSNVPTRSIPARLSIETLLEIQPLIEGNRLPNFPLPPAAEENSPFGADSLRPGQMPAPLLNPSVVRSAFDNPVPNPVGMAPSTTSTRSLDTNFDVNLGSSQASSYPGQNVEYTESEKLTRLLMDPSFGGVASTSSGGRASTSGSPIAQQTGHYQSDSSSNFQGTSDGASASPAAVSSPSLGALDPLRGRRSLPRTSTTQTVHPPAEYPVGGRRTIESSTNNQSSELMRSPSQPSRLAGQGRKLDVPAPTTMNRSLTQAITSPNLSDDLGDSLEGTGTFISSADTNNTISPDVLESLKANHESRPQVASFEVSVTNAEVNRSFEIDLESGSDRESNIDMVAIEGLQVSHSAEVGVSPKVPTYQPYQTDEQTEVASNSKSIVQLENAFDALINRNPETDSNCGYALFDFETMRSKIRQLHQAEGPSTQLQLIEAAYLNQRREFDRALQSIGSIDTSDLLASQSIELAIEQAYAGVGVGKSSLVQDSIEQLGQLDDLGQNKAFMASVVSYFRAQTELLQDQPDFVKAASYAQQSMESIRTASEVESSSPLTSIEKQHLAFILADCHCIMGKSVALGPYENQQEASERWYQSSMQIVSKLISKGKAHPMLKLHCIEHQTRTYCLTDQVKSLPVMVNHYATIQRQMKGQLEPEEESMLQSQLAQLLSSCGMAALQSQEFKAAGRYGYDAINLFESLQGDKALTTWESYCQSKCHWLLGADALWQQDQASAIVSFDRFLETIPASPSLRMEAEQAEQGERMAVASVAYWNSGRKQQAIELNRTAVTQIQIAVEQGMATAQRMDQPLQNLAQMEAAMGTSPTGGTPTMPVSARTSPPMVSYENPKINANSEVSDSGPANLPIEENVPRHPAQARLLNIKTIEANGTQPMMNSDSQPTPVLPEPSLRLESQPAPTAPVPRSKVPVIQGIR